MSVGVGLGVPVGVGASLGVGSSVGASVGGSSVDCTGTGAALGRGVGRLVLVASARGAGTACADCCTGGGVGLGGSGVSVGGTGVIGVGVATMIAGVLTLGAATVTGVIGVGVGLSWPLTTPAAQLRAALPGTATIGATAVATAWAWVVSASGVTAALKNQSAKAKPAAPPASV